MEHQPADRASWGGAQGRISWLVFLCRSLAFSVEVILHRGIGSRFAGMHGPAAVPVILFWSGLCAPHSPAGLLVFLVVFLVACAGQRLGMLKWSRSGARVHSRYSGEPRLWRFLPRCSEESFKCVVEPLLVLVVGVVIGQLDPVLGGYLVVTAVALCVSVNIDARHDQVRALDLLDSAIEHEQFAERFRRLRGDRF